MSRLAISAIARARGYWPGPPFPGVAETFLGRVDHDADDSEEVVSSGDIFLNSPDVELGEDNAEGPQIVGLRIRNLGAFKGTTIDSFTVRLVSKEASQTDGLITRWWAEDADSPAVFTSTNGDLSGRTKTTASVDWDMASWTSDGQEDADTTSPDLSSLLQEVANRSGWDGNLVLLIEKSPTNTDETNPRRAGYSHDTDPALAAQFAINRDHDASEGSTDPGGTTDGDYFVATDGDDSNDGQSEETPFRTIAKAISVVQPGDLVLIRGGTYNEAELECTTSGTQSDPITFAAYPGEDVIHDGYPGDYNPDETGRDMRNGWTFSCDWNVLRDITTKNANFFNLYITGSNNIVRRVTTHGSRYHGLRVAGPGDHLIEDVVSYDNQQPNGGYRSDTDSFQQSADGIVCVADNTTIRRCVAYNNADDGFDLWGSGTGIVIEDCVAFDNGYDEGNGNGFKGSSDGNSSSTFRRCISFGNLRRGFTNNAGPSQTFYNNTSFNNGGSGTDGIGFQNVNEPGNEFKNNLADSNKTRAFEVFGSDPTNTFNTWNDSADAGGDGNFPIADPGFLSTTRTDANFLALSSGSDCIDAGTDVGLTFTGSAPDLGALRSGETIEDLLGRPLDGV